MRILPAAAIAAAVGALAVPVNPAPAQSLLDRSDNISSDWVGFTGTVYFNFVHRFTVSPAPERKVTNLPTFLIATGIASRGLIGVNYATNSSLAPRYPNEWEFFGRYAPLQQDEGAPFDLGGQIDYNLAVKGTDGELSIARREGPVRLIAVTRLVADTLNGTKSRFAYGGGSTIRLGKFIALAGDVATLTSRGAGEKVAWSAGLHLALPNTPHTLSLHASNANTSTIQGLARGGNRVRYGFEFTIPLTIRRFFSNPEVAPTVVADAEPASVIPVPDTMAVRPTPPTAPVAPPVAATPPTAPPSTRPVPPDSTPVRPTQPAAPPVAAPPTTAPRTAPATRPTSPPARTAAPAAPKTVVNARLKGMNFLPSTIQVDAGTTIVWKNLDPLPHTVTAVDKSFTSALFSTDGSYSHTFNKPGTYAVYCMAHPFMKATVIVK